MVSFIEKLKSQFEIWRIEKYTKRRTFLPEYDSRDKDYYDRCYKDGVYHATEILPQPKATEKIRRAPSVATKRASTILRRQSKRRPTTPPRCSETYNANYER